MENNFSTDEGGWGGGGAFRIIQRRYIYRLHPFENLIPPLIQQEVELKQ